MLTEADIVSFFQELVAHLRQVVPEHCGPWNHAKVATKGNGFEYSRSAQPDIRWLMYRCLDSTGIPAVRALEKKLEADDRYRAMVARKIFHWTKPDQIA